MPRSLDMQKAIFWTTALLLAMGPAIGCRKAPEVVQANDKVKLFNEMTEFLAGIKDTKELEQAKPKLMEYAERVRNFKEDDQKRKEKGTTQAELSEAQRDLLREATGKFGREFGRLASMEGGKELMDEFRNKMEPEPAKAK